VENLISRLILKTQTTGTNTIFIDPLFRYKMPKMILKQESRLNGVKTNIFNLDEVAKSLRVPEEGIKSPLI
jgi:hypothetical protein